MNSFQTEPNLIPGCVQFKPTQLEDRRGKFVKLYHEEFFSQAGAEIAPREVFASWSKPGVLRGMHFQLPPHDYAKIVFCQAGAIQDVVLDLRLGSTAYGQFFSCELSARDSNILFIPSGCAHGFEVISQEPALITYIVGNTHFPSHDTGVRWNSFGFPWTAQNPILSDRDQKLPLFEGFKSPFRI